LLVYGTEKEKAEFLYSDKYFFPKRLQTFRTPDFEDALILMDRGHQQHCWEDHCRMEKVCDRKQTCDDICDLVCTPVAIHGAITGNAPEAVGGIVCDKVCHRVCREVEDCKDIKVCETHCESTNTTNGTDTIDENGNVIAHS